MTKSKKKELSDKHRQFIDEYMRDLNATAAYIRTYPKTSYNAARVDASRLLTNANIREEIDKRFKARAMGADEVIARLAEMARGSHYSFVEVNEDGSIYYDFSSEEAKEHLYLIKSIRFKRERQIRGKGEDASEWETEHINVELHDSKDALDKIAKILRLYEDPEAGDKKFTAPQIVEIIKTYERESDNE